jgi:hypothetical protein
LKTLAKIGYALGGIGAIVANLAISGAIIAGVRFLGWWALPGHFALGMLLAALVFVLLLPPHRKAIFAAGWAKKLTLDEGRFQSGVWPWFRKRGPFVLVLAANFLVGPFFAALVIRFLGLRERKAWSYAFVTTLLSSVFWVAVYLGAIEWIRSLLAVVF